MHMAAALLLTMSVTFYLPDAGGINGGPFQADGTHAVIGYAACGTRFPFGTVFKLTVDMSPYGLPQAFECHDRGSLVGNMSLDLVMRTGNLKQDWVYARAWGKRPVPVFVYANLGEYITAEQAVYDTNIAVAQTVTHRGHLTRPTPIAVPAPGPVPTAGPTAAPGPIPALGPAPD